MSENAGVHRAASLRLHAACSGKCEVCSVLRVASCELCAERSEQSLAAGGQRASKHEAKTAWRVTYRGTLADHSIRKWATTWGRTILFRENVPVSESLHTLMLSHPPTRDKHVYSMPWQNMSLATNTPIRVSV